MPSSWIALSLLTSFPTHVTLFSVPFPPAAVSFLVSLVVQFLSCLFLLLLSFFLHFLLIGPILIVLSFLVSCVLTTSPHFPSSDPSGPETPSFSAHRPLPLPKVLTPQHTALCAADHMLGLLRGLIAKACLSPWQCLTGVAGRVYGMWAGRKGLGFFSPYGATV